MKASPEGWCGPRVAVALAWRGYEPPWSSAYALPASVVRCGIRIRIGGMPVSSYRGRVVLSKAFDGKDLVEVRLTGVITSDDQAELASYVRAVIATTGSVRVLVQLEDYGGWRHENTRADDELWLRDDEGVRRLAIVGATSWRDGVLPMLATPVRRLPIAYFGTESAARQWLDRDATESRFQFQ